MFKELKITPTVVFPKGCATFSTLATSIGLSIRSDSELNAAYLDFCNAKGLDPDAHLQTYAEYCLENSVADTSTEGETTYGEYTYSGGMFAARVNLLGLPQVEAMVVASVPKFLKVRSYFHVEEGTLNGSVELVGTPEEVEANNRIVRDIFRTYGFGEIETVLENTTNEDGGHVSVPTLASRTLPR